MKGVYHSELERLTNEHGSVTITLTKEPSNTSRNKDMAGFVTITDWEGTTGRYINIENAAVLAALKQAPLHQPVQIRAGGMGPEAWLQVMGVTSQPQPAPQPVQPVPQQQPQPQPVPVPAAKPAVMRQILDCIEASLDLHKHVLTGRPEFDGVSADALLESVRSVATVAFIELNRDPGRVLRANQAQPAPAPPPPPPPPEPAASEWEPQDDLPF